MDDSEIKKSLHHLPIHNTVPAENAGAFSTLSGNKDSYVPPSYRPDWNDPFDWVAFKENHFGQLAECATAIINYFDEQMRGMAFSQSAIKTFLQKIDALIELQPWLPVAMGGQGNMDVIIKARNAYKANFLGREESSSSYQDAREIVLNVAMLYNYMEAMCEG